jgi:transmembrane sensor
VNPSMDSSRQIEVRAAQWLARRDGDDWTATDQLELEKWLDASTAHHVAYLRLEAAYEESFRLKALGAGAAPSSVPPPGEWQLTAVFAPRPSAPFLLAGEESREGAEIASLPHPNPLPASAPSHPRSGRVKFFSVAATLILAVSGATWHFWPAVPDYKTPVGGTASVPMIDGSHIILNTDSEVRLAVTNKERHVQLEYGEAFFEVAKDSKRPFVVQAGNKRVIAVGTRFSVRRVANDIRVVVTEGKVKLEEADAGAHEGLASPLHAGEESSGDEGLSGAVYVLAGGVARVGGSSVLVQQKPLQEVEEYLSWRTGYLVFRDTQLSEAVAEFNRYNTRKIVIDDPIVAALRLSGKFRPTNFDDFVRLLEDAFPVHAKTSDGTTTLTRN